MEKQDQKEYFKLLDIPIADLSLEEAVDKIVGLIRLGGKHLVVTANPEIILEASRNPRYHAVIKNASLVLADGTGIIIASYVLGRPLYKGRVTGVDLVTRLAERSAIDNFSIFLAGSTKQVLDKTTHILVSMKANIKLAGSYSALEKVKGPDQLQGINSQESANLVTKVNGSESDILLLAFGHPKQELWLAEQLNKLSVRVAIGIGGAFDIISGRIRKAPNLMRRFGLEWLWRLYLEPRRFKRIFNATVLFPLLVIRIFIKNVLRGT